MIHRIVHDDVNANSRDHRHDEQPEKDQNLLRLFRFNQRSTDERDHNPEKVRKHVVDHHA